MNSPPPDGARSVLVLGGASEIGVAVAARLARPRQATVVLAGRHRHALERAARSLFEQAGGGVDEPGAGAIFTLAFDALRPETHDQVVGEAVRLIGADIDVVVVALGVLGDRDRDEHDPVAAFAVGATNYAGAMSATLAASRRLRAQGHGTIVILSSVAGVRVRRSNFIYGSSKAAIDAFARGLSDSLHSSGVRVVIVRPGFVATKMTAGLASVPMSTTPEDIAEATFRAIDTGRQIVWVPAASRYLFAVFSRLPRAVWRRLSL